VPIDKSIMDKYYDITYEGYKSIEKDLKQKRALDQSFGRFSLEYIENRRKG